MSKPYAIFGAGLSALAARRLARAKGLGVVLFDEAGGGDRARFEAGEEADFACFVFSPGFAEEHPWRVLAKASGLPCLSEIAFAARHWEGRIIGITGTNGKSTLTALLDKTLRHSGCTSVAAGNIGYPFSDAALTGSNHPEAFAVVEISSFQAELADGLQLDALLWTNFAEDHLDRYTSMERYFAAKASLFNCLKKGAACVVGRQVADQMAIMGQRVDVCTIACEDQSLLARLEPDSVFKRSPNSENFSLAATLWRLMDKPPGTLVDAVNSFVLAPHRLALVAEVEGVCFWNDSKATNFHAALAALESVDRPIVWIGGGRLKGGDVEAFARQVVPHVDAAIVYGEVADRLARAFAGSLELLQVHPRFGDAVLAAAKLASSMERANVLLSPGFSSFDQFGSYEERGKSFTDTVLSLKSSCKPR